jgi:hypothetical protein
MELLFKTTEDVKIHVGWLYASTNFAALQSDLEMATEDVCAVIGNAVYNRALEHLTSPTAGGGSGSGSGSGSGIDMSAIDDELVRLIQLPVALLAVLSYMENADISHESDGRKVKINKEEESIPWEWMINKDNAAMLRKGNRAIDRLVAYLDAHVDVLSEWAESDQRKDMKALFVPDAATFDGIVPIDNSRVFYIRTLAFNRKEDRNLQSLLGVLYPALKAAMQSTDSLSANNKSLLDLCQECIVYGTMAKAVRHFSVKVLPDSVAQHFDASSQTQKASQAATQALITALEQVYLEDQERTEKRLAYLVKKIAGTTASIYKKDYSNDKFFSA